MKHIPVLLNEVVQGLNVDKGKRFIDATYGGGGHARGIERQGGEVLGIDADPETIERRTQNSMTRAVGGNFRNIEEIAKREGFERIDGILFDLGVSSYQLDTPERGFSYRFTNAPLDLRFDESKGETAAQLVNRITEDELYVIFSKFAEEELARPIAHAIFRARALRPIRTTGDLARIVGRNPARLSRVFQAIRIAVNDELGALKEGLIGAERLLQRNGRLVVISFHSLEDRIVKKFMARENWKMITRKPIVPTRDEIQQNPRARSAKLRIALKL